MQVLDHNPSLEPRIHRNPPLLPRLRERFEQKFMAHWQSQWGGKPILHGRNPGSESIRLDGNDYLGLSGNPDIVRAQMASLQHSNESVIQSGVFLLDAHPCRTLEASLAAWVGKEDGFVCQSGYSANVGLLQAIADEQTPVYLDSLAHTSLWEGVRAARAPAYAFRHNDPAHLLAHDCPPRTRRGGGGFGVQHHGRPVPAAGDGRGGRAAWLHHPGR